MSGATPGDEGAAAHAAVISSIAIDARGGGVVQSRVSRRRRIRAAAGGAAPSRI
jgi:hypothetical protein